MQVCQSFGKSPTDRSRRAGTVLIVVVVAVVMLSFGAYSFSELMVSEHVVSRHLVKRANARCQLESVVETLCGWFDEKMSHGADRNEDWRSLVKSVQALAQARGLKDHDDVEVFPSRSQAFAALQTNVFAESETGLLTESSKLNVNALPVGKHQRKLARSRLMALPNMTPQIADAILDWMDGDDEPSEFGAESNYYTTLPKPYRPRQGRFISLEELLLVRGVTPALLFGDSTSTPAARGWCEFLTLRSKETTRPASGNWKINVNHEDLAELFDAIQREFNADAARFVVAWRLAGAITGSEDQRADNPAAGTLVAPKEDPDEDFELFETDKNSARRRIKSQLGNDDEAPDLGSAGVAESGKEDTNVVRAGIVVSRKPAYTIRSLVDLIECSVRIDVDRRDTVLRSPWIGDERSIGESIKKLEEKLTVTDRPIITGRINIDSASPEVLLSVPGLSEAEVESLLNARRRGGGLHSPLGGSTIGWLVSEGVIDLRKLKQIAPYITCGGDVWRGVVVTKGAGRHACEFEIDASVFPARLNSWYEIPVDQIGLHSYELWQRR